MKLSALPLSSLHVNRSNDRHGGLANEEEAINWLLDNNEHHMRNLTKDIVEQGKLYEPPLVRKVRSSHVVYDGNRRITCLKLLDEPSRAPSTQWQEFFAGEKKRWTGRFITRVGCQVEDDRNEIDEILFRRHTGSQAGVGQSKWDDTAKDNFISRTDRPFAASSFTSARPTKPEAPVTSTRPVMTCFS